jgi:hypothetical protein
MTASSLIRVWTVFSSVVRPPTSKIAQPSGANVSKCGLLANVCRVARPHRAPSALVYFFIHPFSGRTPNLFNVIPRTVYPTMTTTFKGGFGTENKEDIKPIMIGDSLCDRFADEKVEADTYITSWDGEVNC